MILIAIILSVIFIIITLFIACVLKLYKIFKEINKRLTDLL